MDKIAATSAVRWDLEPIELDSANRLDLRQEIANSQFVLSQH
jgi:hypothetical protein